MPGVYRDDRGGYSYQSNNTYEDRRRDDLDRRYGSLRPVLPPPPEPFKYHPPLFPETPAGPPAPPAPPPVAVLQPAPAIDFNALDWMSADKFSHTLPQVAEWPGPDVPQTVSAVDFHELNSFIDQLPNPPARVGDVPEFDAAFDQLAAAGRSVTYQPFEKSLLAPAGTEWVPFDVG